MPGWTDFACSTASMASVLTVSVARRASRTSSGAEVMRGPAPVPASGWAGRQRLLEIGGERAHDLLVLRLVGLAAHDEILHFPRVRRPGDEPAAVDQAEG